MREHDFATPPLAPAQRPWRGYDGHRETDAQARYRRPNDHAWSWLTKGLSSEAKALELGFASELASVPFDPWSGDASGPVGALQRMRVVVVRNHPEGHGLWRGLRGTWLRTVTQSGILCVRRRHAATRIFESARLPIDPEPSVGHYINSA